MPPEDTNIVSTQPTAPHKKKFNLTMDFRLLAGVLLVVIAVMLFLWKPWDPQPKAGDRTITVTGDTTVTAAPDEYTFYPSYDFKSSDRQTALSEMGKLDDTIVAKLKSLGVAENKIKLDSSGYTSDPSLPATNADGTTTYTLSMTIKIDNKDLAQKVQDYLLTTNPTGNVTPTPSFSEGKKKQLQNQGRDKATREARAKAEQSAKNLGFKIIGVKSVDDSGDASLVGCAGSVACPTYLSSDLKSTASPNSSSLSVQPGEDELDYSVKVVYYIH